MTEGGRKIFETKASPVQNCDGGLGRWTIRPQTKQTVENKEGKKSANRSINLQTLNSPGERIRQKINEGEK